MIKLDPIYQKSDLQIIEDLGNAIRKHRLSKNLSQSELAKEAGLSRSTISDFENGKSTNLISFIQILRCLDILEKVKHFIPEEKPSPLELLKKEKKERKRASRQESKDDKGGAEW